MIEPRSRWTFPTPVEVGADVAAAGQAAGLSARVVEVLVRRGLATAAELSAYVGEPLDGLHDPNLLPDADTVLVRLRAARTAGERVMVFGDFDADGLTGLATMVLALRAFGLAVDPYVPSRLDEGHGLSVKAVEAAVEAGVRVIVTVDCGSTSVAEIAAAGDRGIDVIITDHHRVPPDRPAAHALVNPHRTDSAYPDSRLTGSGVAFKVAQLLLGDEPGGPATALGFADLATIGTVADVAPILGENRAIARLGLDRIRTNTRPGIVALLARAGIAPGVADLETVGFAIAPRINAAGRVGEALDAALLLLADDPAEAERLADILETANGTRRDLARVALDEARLLASGPDDAATLVRGAWPVGIIGLVAGRLAEELGRPAIVGAELGDVVRGSCRAAAGFDLAGSLEACADLLIRHGGHAGAAGFEVAATDWDAFRTRFLVLASGPVAVDRRPGLRLDLALLSAAVDYGLFRELALLAPFGPGNPDPLVGLLGLTVTRVRPAKGGHTQLTLRRERDVLDAIAFGRDDLATTVAEGDRVDVVARLASRTFGGYESLQLEVRDVATSGSHPEAAAILGGGLEIADGSAPPGQAPATPAAAAPGGRP